MYVCMRVFTYVLRLCVCMTDEFNEMLQPPHPLRFRKCIHVCNACVYVRMYEMFQPPHPLRFRKCIYVCMYACIYVCIASMCMYEMMLHSLRFRKCIYVCNVSMYVRMYLCMYCVYVYV